MSLEKPFKVLAISGSLRNASSNTAILKAAQQLAPAHLEIVLFESLAELPHFNPDLESEPPATVLEFQQLLQTSNAVIISSPEYAHGVPGSLKNALDWLVGSGTGWQAHSLVWRYSSRGVCASQFARNLNRHDGKPD